MDTSHIGPPPLPEFSEPSSAAAAETTPHKGTGSVKAFDDKGGPSFSDLLDIINPLQHIPVINTIYQKLTGDTEGAVADVVGGALWGGVIGLGCAVANLVVQDSTGDTLSGHVMAMFDDGKPARTATATATVEKPTVAAPPPSAVVVQQAALPPTGPQASLDAPPPKAAPRDSVSTKVLTSPAAAVTPTVPNGPMRAGDFLIFGGTVTTPTVATKTPVAADTAPVSDSKTNDFMVFGSLGSKPATSLPLPLPATAVATAEQSAEPAPTPAPAPAPAPTLTGSANPAGGNGLKMPVTRNAMPPAHLGLPTTGPAAVPGHQGETQVKASNDWIVGTMAANMDKYQKAAKLGTASEDTASKDGTEEKPAIAPPAPVDGN